MLRRRAAILGTANKKILMYSGKIAICYYSILPVITIVIEELFCIYCTLMKLTSRVVFSSSPSSTIEFRNHNSTKAPQY